MELIKVISSNIDSVGYFPNKETGVGDLFVRFHGGKLYKYEEVPMGIYDRLMRASSMGEFLDQYVKKAGYKYEEVKELPVDIEQALAEEAAKLMGYPVTTELILDRIHNPPNHPALIDALWKLLVKYRKGLER